MRPSATTFDVPQSSFRPARRSTSRSAGNAEMRTKALLIGIQYDNSEYWESLDGPHRDVHRMKDFLRASHPFGQYRVLMDKPGYRTPDRQGIIDSLLWLVEGATEDHRLFLHYSGHGDQSPNSSGSETDGRDETIIPVDCPAITKDCPPDCDCHETSSTCARPAYRGMIRDNDLRAILVDMLPPGAHLTTLFDCCHSGTILDLKFCYPRYVSIPRAWKSSGPAYCSPRLNYTSSSSSGIKTRKSTMPTPKWFRETVPPDMEELREPIAVPQRYFKTPTQRNPQGLEDAEDTPRAKVSTLARVFSFRNSFQSLRTPQSQAFALTRERVAALNRMSDFENERRGEQRKPSLGFGLQLFNEAILPIPVATGSPRPSTSSSSLAPMTPPMPALPPLIPLSPPPLQLAPLEIESWRGSVQPFADDTYISDSPTPSSPVRTLSISSRRSSLVLSHTFLQREVSQVQRAVYNKLCYENEDIDMTVSPKSSMPTMPKIAEAPFPSLGYDRPIKRATFAGFYYGPQEEAKGPRVIQFSACYDDQVVFETINGDGLLTEAFIQGMRESGSDITYEDLMKKMKQFFIRKNEARGAEEKFKEPPFPMLASSYHLNIKNKVEL